MKVLIATATAGGGHLAAAAALEEAWSARFPKDTVRRVDILDYTPKLYRKAYAEGYVRLAERAPELYAHAFRKTDTAAFVRRIAKLRRLGARLVTGKFIKDVERFAPEVILAPHFLPLEAIGAAGAWRARCKIGPDGDDATCILHARHHCGGRPLLVSVITDFEAHALWMEPRVDLYCVATEATKARLIARGVPQKQVVVTGIPVSARFKKSITPPAGRRALDLDPKRPLLLVVGGGMGMGPMEEMVRGLDGAEADFQMTVVTGRNEALRQRLTRKRFRHSTRILGFVGDMERWMSAADLLVTKPGGLTTSEALALGRPLLIVNPLPGQEAANSDFLLAQGAAVKANRLDDLPYVVEQALQPKHYRRLAQAAKRLGRPQAADAICRASRTRGGDR